jgi:gliding motility-associated lipoprotein GldH
MKPLLMGMALLFSLSACGPDYLAQAHFEDGCWPLQDTLRFDWAVEAQAPRTLQVDLTLDADYRYQNLYLKLQYQGPAGQQGELLLQDTLIDPTGHWLAERQGARVQWTITPAPALPFTEAGTYQMALFHYMRDSSLCEVYEVAVRRGE